MAYLNGKQIAFSPKVTINPPPPQRGIVPKFYANTAQIESLQLYETNVPAYYLYCEFARPNMISSIKKIELMNAKYIYSYAFYGLNNVQSINMREGLLAFGDGAFKNCYSLSINELPTTLTSVGANCFENCYNIQFLTFRNTPSTIGADAFKGMSSYAEIRVPWSSGAVSGAPWGFTGTIVYNYQG